MSKTKKIILIIFLVVLSLNLIFGIPRIIKIAKSYKDELNDSQVIKDNIGIIEKVYFNPFYDGRLKNNKFLGSTMLVKNNDNKFYKIRINYLYDKKEKCYVINEKEICDINTPFLLKDYENYIDSSLNDINVYHTSSKYFIKYSAIDIWKEKFNIEEIKLEDIFIYYDSQSKSWYAKGKTKTEKYNIIIDDRRNIVIALWKENY